MKRFSALGLVLLLSLFATACGTKPAAQQTPAASSTTGTPAAQPAVQQKQNTPEAQQKPQLTSAKIATYYTDSNLLELQKEEQEIGYQDDADKYKQAIELLGKPKEKAHEPLWQNFKFNSVSFEKGKLTIDASSKNEYNIGSTGEMLAIDALKQTLFQFPEVKQIVILEDGKKVESLMGHFDVSEPLTR